MNDRLFRTFSIGDTISKNNMKLILNLFSLPLTDLADNYTYTEYRQYMKRVSPEKGDIGAILSKFYDQTVVNRIRAVYNDDDIESIIGQTCKN